MSEVTPEEHAARLRLIRNMHGMLMHPECDKVLTAEQWGQICDVLTTLRNVTPMTEADFIEYGRAGARDLVVKWSDEKARYVFAYAASTATGR